MDILTWIYTASKLNVGVLTSAKGYLVQLDDNHLKVKIVFCYFGKSVLHRVGNVALLCWLTSPDKPSYDFRQVPVDFLHASTI